MFPPPRLSPTFCHASFPYSMTERSRPPWPLGTHSGSSDTALHCSQKRTTRFWPHNKPTRTRPPLERGPPTRPQLRLLQQQVNASLPSPRPVSLRPGRASHDGGWRSRRPPRAHRGRLGALPQPGCFRTASCLSSSQAAAGGCGTEGRVLGRQSPSREPPKSGQEGGP